MKVDCLVFGQGLAGSAFVQQCIQAGKSVFVVKDPTFKTASKVAAGLYNPLSGQKLHLPKKGDLLFEALVPFYKSSEEWLKTKILYPTPIYRAFSNEEQKNYFFDHANEFGHEKWHENNPILENRASELLANEYGGIEVKEGGFVDIPAYLDAVEQYLISKNAIEFESYKATSFIQIDSGYKYNNIEAKHVVFAMGVGFDSNDWFKWLPILGLKGDVFELTFESHSFDFILNRELFVLPFKENCYKAGSTYRRKFDDNKLDEIGKSTLEHGLNKILKVPYRILKHESAVRPTAGDHHPIIGEHPTVKNMYCLNGLGSKGVTLAPYATKQLFDAVFSKKEIDAQLNISRFYSLFYKKKY